MDSRERVTHVLTGRTPDRVPMDDTYWQTTMERWWREGLPQDASPRDLLGTNEIVRIAGDDAMRFPERVLEESATMRTYWDTNGALRKDLHLPEGWTSQWLDFTIKVREDWDRERWRMAYNDERIPETALETYGRARAEGKFVCYSSHACFHPTWMRIGMEHMFMTMLDDPDFIYSMNAAHAQLVIDIYEGIKRIGIAFDGAFMADDLGYRASPLISPALYRKLVLPHHRRLCEHFAADGLRTILHSDGNIEPLIPHFLDAGFAGLHPLEVKAGLDVRNLKPRFGDRLVFFGNIDVRTLAGTREEIEEEIASKLPIAKENGGYIYHSDHSVPNDVSLENYRFALEMVRKYGSYD